MSAVFDNNPQSEKPQSRFSKLAAAPLLISALFVGEAPRGDDIDSSATRATIPPPTPLRIPASSLHQREETATKELQPAVGGVELVKHSAASELLKQLHAFWSQGKSAPDELVAQLLAIAVDERGTFIAAERFRSILDQNPTREVYLRFLDYHLQSQFHLVSDKTLARFWSSEDPEILSRALLCKAEGLGRITPRDFFIPFEKHASRKVRQACAIAMMVGGHSLPDLSPFDLFQCSTLLSLDHHVAGLEGRLALDLAQKLYPGAELSSQKQASPNHITALLHLLQRIDQAFPGYLESAHVASPEHFNQIARSLSDTIKRERDALLEKELVSPQGHAIIALHFETQFSGQKSISMLEDVGVTDILKVKAGKLPDGSHGVDQKPITPIPDSEYRRKYLAELDTVRSPHAKKTYCSELGRRSKDKTRPLFVVNSMHGGPDHSWFYHGAPGYDQLDDISVPRAISHQDIANTLFQAADISQGTLSLGHVCIILEACRQYTVAQEVLVRIEELARRAGVEIISYPSLISISQPFMYAAVPGNITSIFPSNEDEAKKIPKKGLVTAEFLASTITRDLAVAAKERKTVRFRDLFESDENTADASFQKLRDPKLLLSGIPLNEEETKRAAAAGLGSLKGADNPAIFGPNPFRIGHELEIIIEAIRKTSPDCPPLPEKDRANIATFLEVS